MLVTRCTYCGTATWYPTTASDYLRLNTQTYTATADEGSFSGTYSVRHWCPCRHQIVSAAKDLETEEFEKTLSKAVYSYSKAVFHPEDINKSRKTSRALAKKIKPVLTKMYSHRKC